MFRYAFTVRLFHSLHLAGSMLAHRVGATTRHPRMGAVEQPWVYRGNHCRIRQLKGKVSKSKAFSGCYMATTENKPVSGQFAIKASVGSPERFL